MKKYGVLFILISIIAGFAFFQKMPHKNTVALTSNGADYAEWFEKEGGAIMPSDVIGLNIKTGKVRKYVEGDVLLGICSGKPGFIGDKPYDKTEEEMDKAYVLVALVGKLRVNKEQTNIVGREVKTKDDKLIGFIINDGRVLIKIK
jgi:hypothetical protein